MPNNSFQSLISVYTESSDCEIISCSPSSSTTPQNKSNANPSEDICALDSSVENLENETEENIVFTDEKNNLLFVKYFKIIERKNDPKKMLMQLA